MKKILTIAICLCLVCSLFACGSSNSSTTAAASNPVQTETPAKNELVEETEAQKNENNEAAASNKSAEEYYNDILIEYSEKIREATPNLIDEYYEEAKDNDKGLEGLAEIANSKVEELAKINNDGVSEMAKVMMTKGSGSYSEYEKWANELMNVYMEESNKIMDAYMGSV